MSISKILLACGFAMASLSLSTAHAAVETKTTEKKAVKKAQPAKAKAAKSKAAKPAAAAAAATAAAAAAAAVPNEEADEPTITDSNVTEFDCELGNKVTIYENAGDDSHIALRWKKRLHRLTRVGTTTGAQRFENKLYGLIWIGIPAKSMLLDSKLNRQLANECRHAEQLKPVALTEPPHDGATTTTVQ